MSIETDEQIVVVGAGPAGLAAATALVSYGANVLLIDAGQRVGGQYWRHSAGSALSNKHEEMRIISHPNVEYLPDTNVWAATYLDGISTLHLLMNGAQERKVITRWLIMATGAYDRSLPIPGWDLPGVMTTGGVQALLKGEKRLAGKEFVVAGTGPFLLPVAVGLIMSGAKVNAIVEAAPLSAWLTNFGGLARSGNKFRDFATFQKIIRTAKVKIHYGSAIVAAHGTNSLESVTLQKIGRDFLVKRRAKIKKPCDVLAVGWGFTPDISLASALGCRTKLESRDGSLIVAVDENQGTSLVGIYAAGEATGVGGSALALTEGKIAATAVAQSIGLIESTKSAKLIQEQKQIRRKQQIFANALLDVYRVADGWTTWPTPETIICRCEEVTVGQLRDSISELGVSDSKSAKSLTRAGMGMCQGRVCGQAVSEFVAKECGRKVTLADLQGGAKRPIITPIPLGLLANGISDRTIRS